MRTILITIILAGTAVACLAEPPAAEDQPKFPTKIGPLEGWDLGVQYEPEADYQQGVLAAEEEIESNTMSLWVLALTNQPPEKDPSTGLPVTPICAGSNEPWHRQCMEHRIRGHNDTILKHLYGPQPQGTNAVQKAGPENSE